METNNNIVDGLNGGNHISGTPLTTENAAEATPSLLVNAIDQAIVKVRPMATPLDQISRMGNTRPVDSMEVDYYSVDTRADRDEIVTFSEARDVEGAQCKVYSMSVQHPSRFETSDTFTSLDMPGENLFYIMEKRADGTLIVGTNAEEVLTPGTQIIRMGRAATQLDVQTPQFAALPTKSTNFCQIFKMQIEQSVVMKLSHKEIGWDFNDQQEAAVYDMRLGMEKQFLFGIKSKIYDPIKGETVTMTGGIWKQAGREILVDLNEFDSSALIDMLRSTFAENSGSRRKVLMAGSNLISALNKIEHTHVITARDQVTAWGIDFSELQSKFGKLFVVYSDIFDLMGMPGNGIIIDPEYIQKHVFIPFNAETLDLRGSGQRNCEALVMTEASCLTLRYPEAHARIIGV
ncbi:MAG: DUF5309 domain-containing protein [Prevotella sp.]|nr:DUF5309 domain-containing protein [Prevotella sp.]MCM1074897.1 DUF5309 domain-containing protein [Ruminococcus sp.]